MTTIQDTVTYVDGSVASGKIILTWPPMQYGGVAIAAGQQEYEIGPNGAISITCYPCVGAQPQGVYFTATYELDEGAVYDEYWLVPDAATATIGAVRASAPATPSIMINAQQLTMSGALSGQFLGWNGFNWVPMYPGPFNSAVQSFNGRLGAVMPQTGDYTAAMITGALADPTTTLGDLVVRGPTAVERLGVGADGQVLTADSTQPLGVKWATTIAGVSSVFGRTGAVVAVAGDYTAALVTNAVDQTQAYANPAWITSLAWSKITGAPVTGVSSVFGRTGAVVAAAGDYSAYYVPLTTQVIAGIGLSGGGALSGNVTLTVAPNTTQQLIQAASGGTAVGSPRPELNFIAGSGTSFNVTDNPTNNRVDITISLTGSGPATNSIYAVNGAVVGTQPELNLIAGTGTTISGTNNTGANRVDVTVQATAVGGVSSFNTRTGAVMPAAGDYTAAQVTNAVDSTQSYANPAWITSLAYSKITGAPATGVSSVFTRTGAVVAQTGDYTAAQVTNAVDQTQTYANPAWITTLAWAKITGTPAMVSSISPGTLSGAVTLAAGTGISITQSGQTITITATTTGGYWQAGSGGAIYYSGGNVGIGLTSPLTFLEIAPSTTNSSLKIGGLELSSYSATNVSITDNLYYNGSSWTYRASGPAAQINLNAGQLAFGFVPSGSAGAAASVANAMQITNAGNVGIGTISPTTNLAVTGASGGTTTVLFGNAAGPNSFDFYANAGSNDLSANLYYNGTAWGLRNTTYDGWLLGMNVSTSAGAGAFLLYHMVAGATTLVNFMTMTGNGSLGIGTSNPSYTCHVNGSFGVTMNSNSLTRVPIVNQSTGSGARNDIQVGAGSNNMFLGVEVTLGAYGWGEYSYIDSTSPLYITAATVLMNSAVGIGTKSPAAPLDVETTGSAVSVKVGNGVGYMTLSGGDGSNAYINVPSWGLGLQTNGVTRVFITTAGSVGIGITPPSATYVFSVHAAANENLGITAAVTLPGAVGLNAMNDAGGANVPLEIRSSLTCFTYGNVGIGMTSAAYALSVTGDVNCTGAFRVNGTAISTGGITGITWELNGTNYCGTNGGTGICNMVAQGGMSLGASCATNGINYTFATSSDVRLKQNVETLTGGLPVIDQLRPIRAQWNGLLGHTAGQPLASVIAQEVQSILPEAVSPFRTQIRPQGEEIELLSIDPMAFVAHLILAVQQLQQRIKQLEEK